MWTGKKFLEIGCNNGDEPTNALTQSKQPECITFLLPFSLCPSSAVGNLYPMLDFTFRSMGNGIHTITEFS